MESIYLLWDSYKSNNTYKIGKFIQTDENEYVFYYLEDALKAIEEGCFLPFPYQNIPIVFDSIPPFFSRRVNTRDMKTSDIFSKLDGCCINNDNFHLEREKSLKK